MSVVTVFQLRKALELVEEHAKPGFKQGRYRNIEIETDYPNLIVSTGALQTKRTFVVTPFGNADEQQKQEAA